MEKPGWLSYQGWKELVSLFPNERMDYAEVHMLLAVLGTNIIDGKDTGEDLIRGLQMSIVSKISEIKLIQDLIKSSDLYKSGEITDLIIET